MDQRYRMTSIGYDSSFTVVSYCTATTQTDFQWLKKTSHHSRDVSCSLRRGRREEERQKESWFFFHTVANTLFLSEFQRGKHQCFRPFYLPFLLFLSQCSCSVTAQCWVTKHKGQGSRFWLYIHPPYLVRHRTFLNKHKSEYICVYFVFSNTEKTTHAK